jgi:hypothetical protein
MDEETALKAAGCKSFGGSIPSSSAIDLTIRCGYTINKQGGSNGASTSQNDGYPNWFSGTSLIRWVRKYDVGSNPTPSTSISSQNYLFLRVLAAYKTNIKFPNI